MPRTIEEGFRDFLSRLTPSTSESAAAKSHRASIEACLKSNLGLRRFARIGSYGNGTSISGFSDVDYLASLPRAELSNSSTYSLTKVREVLDNRFWASGVRVNCPAVVVPFGTSTSETTEIVPADYVGEEGSFSIYEIPDCKGGWMRASPDAHNMYVRQLDQRLGGKLKPLIRFAKAWKFYRQVPISSFYLELRVAKLMSDESSIIYDIDLTTVFCRLWDCGLAAMQDPMGISGHIPAAQSAARLTEARSKLETAATRAEKARDARGTIDEAFVWWRLLFDDNFPSYYY